MNLDGQLSHFTSAGTLRSGPHPHDPETTLWYLETTGTAPDIALTQMPVWVKQALERPPLSAAPSPPRSSRTTRKPRAPSPSTSSPEMEIYRTPKQASGQTAHAPSCELPHLEHAKPEATENGDLEAAVAASSGDLASPATGAVEPALKQSEDAAYMPVVRWTYLALDRFDVALLSLSAPLAACLCSADHRTVPWPGRGQCASSSRCRQDLRMSIPLQSLRARCVALAPSSLLPAPAIGCLLSIPAHFGSQPARDLAVISLPPCPPCLVAMDDSDSDLLLQPSPDSEPRATTTEEASAAEWESHSWSGRPYSPVNVGTPVQ